MQKNIFSLMLMGFLIPSTFYSQDLMQVVELNDIPTVMRLVENGADINQTDRMGFTPLHVAAWNGYVELTEYLLQKGANPNVLSQSGNTPLKFANPAITKLLLRYGAFTNNTAPPVPELRYTPNVYIESSSPRPRVINRVVSNFIAGSSYPEKSYNILKKLSLEESLQVHNWDKNGNNSLHRAAQAGNLERVKLLIKSGIDPNSRNNNGDTPLRFAAENGHLEVIKYLVEQEGVDINARNNSGTSPLMVASLNNDPKIVNYLTHFGANVNVTATAFVRRIREGEGEVDTTVEGWTPLMAAAQMGDNKTIQALLDANADLNATDNDNWNALMYAVQSGHLDTARYLVKAGIDLNVESAFKQTALSIAVDAGNQPMVDFLKSVNAKDSSEPLLKLNETVTEIPPTAEELAAYEAYKKELAAYEAAVAAQKAAETNEVKETKESKKEEKNTKEESDSNAKKSKK